MRRQDLGVLFLYYIGYSAFRKFLLSFQRKRVAVFVYFHDVLPENVRRFGANMRFLKRSTNVISLRDFLLGRLAPGKINVVVTFDDGYRSWVTDVMPILKELRLPATFFVSSGFVGLSKVQQLEFVEARLLKANPEECSGGLSAADLRQLVEEGFDVGGHTSTHCNLADLRDEAEIRRQIVQDREKLEELTGKRIEHFAYPFGACRNPSVDLVELLQECGYRAALTVVPGFNDETTNRYLLHREGIDASMSSHVFRARVHGNYEAISWLKRQVERVFRPRRAMLW